MDGVATNIDHLLNEVPVLFRACVQRMEYRRGSQPVYVHVYVSCVRVYVCFVGMSVRLSVCEHVSV